MSDYRRIRQKQSLSKAQGYLELAMGFSDQLVLAPQQRIRLAERALDALAGISDMAGQEAQVLFLTGQAYRTMHRYRDALSPLEAAADLDPENIQVWLALAWCQRRTGRLDLAIQSLENALSADPHEAILHFNLACYWSLAGNAQEAMRYLTQSLAISPAYRDLVDDETDFDSIRDLPDFRALTSAIV